VGRWINQTKAIRMAGVNSTKSEVRAVAAASSPMLVALSKSLTVKCETALWL
jgi:hypothetical protein